MDTSSTSTPSLDVYNKRLHTKNVSDDSGYKTLTPCSADTVIGESSDRIDSIVDVNHSFNPATSSSFTTVHAIGSVDANIEINLSSIKLDERRCSKAENAFSEEMDVSQYAEDLKRFSYSPYSLPHLELCYISNKNVKNSNESEFECSFDPIACDSNIERPEFNPQIIHKTPKRPNTKGGCRKITDNCVKDKRINKSFRQTHFRQKIGTPERNRLLYPRIKIFTPPRKQKSPEKDINCKKVLDFGDRKIDFLKKFQRFPHIIKNILCYLSGDDLVNVCNVSCTWKNICSGDLCANERKTKHSFDLIKDKENFSGNKVKSDPKVNTIKIKLGLCDKQNMCNVITEKNVIPKSPNISPKSRKYSKFWKVASQGSDVYKCFRCENPAVLDGRWAKCVGCGFTFCKNCHCEKCSCKSPIGSPKLNEEKPSKTQINYKAKRKALKRLLF